MRTVAKNGNTIIKDPIHGNIVLNNMEKKIVNSAVFQRLHRIKQLGFCYLVYPGAKHTRFGHSIGTFYLADRITKTLNLDGYTSQLLKLAGLLHDIGHGAFSHDSEDVTRKYIGSHEENGLKIIKQTEIRDFVGEYYDDLIKILDEKEENEELDIIGSDVGADRLDYLVRDAYYTGVSYGTIDSEWITDIILRKDNLLCLPEKGVPAAESLLVGRFLMFNTVYLHRTNRIAASMFKRALEIAIEGKNIDPKEITFLGDDELLIKLKEHDEKEYVGRLLNRRLYKLAIRIDKKDIPMPIKEFEEEIIKRCNCDVIVDEIRPFVSAPKVPIIAHDSGIDDISEFSSLVNVLVNESERRSKMFVISEDKNVENVKKEVLKLFESNK